MPRRMVATSRMEQGQPLVHLGLGIGAVLGEDLVAQVAIDDPPSLLPGRDGGQAAVADERADGPGGERLVGLERVIHGWHRTMPRMPPDQRRIGAHLPLATGMVRAVDRAHEIGADALQIWTDNPTAWRRRAEPPTELDAFVERLGVHGIGPVAIHAAYLCNLAGPDPAFFAATVDILATELRGAPSFAARFVNVHIGSHRDSGVDVGVARVAEGIRLTLAEVDDAPDAARLVLENSAGAGWGLGVDLDELAAIADAIDARGRAPPPGGLLPRHGARVGRRARRQRPRGHRRLPGQLRRAHRPRPPGHDPPQRLALRARLAAGPTRAPRRRSDRAGRSRAPAPSPGRGPRRGHPGDARHGRGLRRDQPRPGAGPRGRTTARGPAPRGVHLRSARTRTAPA